MSAARLAARVAACLDGRAPVAVGGVDGACWRRALRAAGMDVAGDEGSVEGAVVSFLGQGADPAARRETLAALRARLGPAGRLVVVDHNQPRRWLPRVIALPWLWRHRLAPERARYPTAREIAANGFMVEALRLAAGERVQLVVARPR